MNTPFSGDEPAILKELFKNAGNCVRRAPEHYAFYVEELLGQLAGMEHAGALAYPALRNTLCRLMLSAAEPLCGGGDSQRPEARIAGKAEQIMRDRTGHNLSMTGIAKTLGPSTTGFIKRFKAETGLTPADFLLRVKIQTS